MAASIAVGLVAASLVVAPPASAATTGASIRGASNSTTVTVPAGVTEMDVVLQGGNGGAGARPANERAAAGQGSTVTIQHIPVVAGQKVRLVGADNGTNSGAGGNGYVKGGAGGQPRGANGSYRSGGVGGGGGGAAAVLIDGEVIAVAGGGGGSGGGTFDTYTSGNVGGAGGTAGAGVPGEPVGTGGAAGQLVSATLPAASAGGAGGTSSTDVLSGGGGGGGAGVGGGSGGAAGQPGGGGGGAAGGSAALSHYAGAQLAPVITPGVSSSGSVAVTWRYAPALTIDPITATISAGGRYAIVTNASFPSGHQVGAHYTVTLEGHGQRAAMSQYLRNEWQFSTLKAGSWTVTVTAQPWDPAMGPITVTSTLVVTGGATSGVTVTVSDAHRAVGEPRTLTAQLSQRTAGRATQVPTTGSVQFFANGEPIGAPRSVTFGSTQVSTVWTAASEGEFAITAHYDPDVLGISASDSAPVFVTAGRRTAGLIATAPATGIAGEPVTVTARTSGAVPGRLALVVEGPAGWSVEDAASVSAGEAVAFEIPSPPEGRLTATVTFVPDDRTLYLDSVRALTLDLARISTSTTVELPATGSALVPLIAIARVALDANTGDRSPTGEVTFVDGTGEPLGDPVATPTIVGTRWAEYVLEVTPRGAGELRVTAEYRGTESQSPSTSDAAIVTIASWPTQTTIALGTSSIAAHETVDVVAHVQSAIPGGGTRRGEAQLHIDGVPVGDPVPVVNGVARLTLPAYQERGERGVSVSYSDDGGAFEPSTSTSEALRIEGITTSIELSTVGTHFVGQENELRVRVSGADGQTVDGLVSVLVDGIAQGTATLVDGEVTTRLPVAPDRPMTVEVSYVPSLASLYLPATNSITIAPEVASTTTVLDPILATRAGAPIDLAATVTSASDLAHPPTGTLRFLVSGSETAEILATSDDEGVFRGTFIPSRPGEVRVVAEFIPTPGSSFAASTSTSVVAEVSGFPVRIVAPTSVTFDQSAGGRVAVTVEQDDADPVTAQLVSGAVTFTMGAVQRQVVVIDGTAEYIVPAGLAAGEYELTAQFSDATGWFADSDAVSIAVTVEVPNEAPAPGAPGGAPSQPGSTPPKAGGAPSGGGAPAAPAPTGGAADGAATAHDGDDAADDGSSAGSDGSASGAGGLLDGSTAPGAVNPSEAGATEAEAPRADSGSDADALVWWVVAALVLLACGVAALAWRVRSSRR